MNESASWATFTFISFFLTGVRCEPGLIVSKLNRSCPVSVQHTLSDEE